MKLKSLLVALGLGLCSIGFASNQTIQYHPQAAVDKKTAAAGMTYPNYCEIEILNRSYSDVTVFGIFDDGVSMDPFNVYSFGAPRYISLYYYGYCHAGMDLSVYTFDGDYVYSGYTRVGTTVRIVPYLKTQLKAELVAKS